MANIVSENRYRVDPPSLSFNLPLLIWQEAFISWKFIQYNLLSTIVPGTLFLIVALIANHVPFIQWIAYIPLSLVYFGFYVYTFDLSNQYVGYEEDLINKPSRPLPSGLVTEQGTLFRWVIVSGLYLILASMTGVVVWTYIWLLAQIVHNFYRGASHWLIKNGTMGIGVFVQLAVAWQVVAPLNAIAIQWILMFAIMLFIVIGLQDLRDVEGDLAVGRKTMPIAFGEMPSRYFLALTIGLIPMTIFVLFVSRITLSPIGYFHWAVMVALCFTVAFRVLFLRDANSDHISYRYLVIWYSVALLMGMWVL